MALQNSIGRTEKEKRRRNVKAKERIEKTCFVFLSFESEEKSFDA